MYQERETPRGQQGLQTHKGTTLPSSVHSNRHPLNRNKGVCMFKKWNCKQAVYTKLRCSLMSFHMI